MTAEEKARAYDEAMDRCKEWVSGTWEHSVDDTPKDIAEFIFPQLAESENEKIRKELVAFFKEMRDTWHEIYWHDLQVEGILAWLEEQKEPEVDLDADEQPEADLEKEIQKYLEKLGGGHGGYVDDLTDDDLMGFAHHFYELGKLNARKEEEKE